MGPKQRWLGTVHLGPAAGDQGAPKNQAWSLSCRHTVLLPLSSTWYAIRSVKIAAFSSKQSPTLGTLVQCYWPRSGVRFLLVVNECLVLNKVDGNTVINEVTVVLCNGGDKGGTHVHCTIAQIQNHGCSNYTNTAKHEMNSTWENTTQ